MKRWIIQTAWMTSLVAVLSITAAYAQAPILPGAAPDVATVLTLPQTAPNTAPPSGELRPAEPNAGPVPALADMLSQVAAGVDRGNVALDPANPQNAGNAAATAVPGTPGMTLPMGAPVAEDPNVAEEKFRREAYDSMMEGMLPMRPDELREAFHQIDRNQKAIEEPLAYPKPEVSFTTISLDPAATPLTFKLATGHVTTVNFLDITGQPWPIKDITWAGNFEIKSSSQGVDERFPMYPNLLRIIPLSEHAYGNMSIRMLGLSTPITFTLRTNRDVVQYRLDLRVPEKGPFALPSIIETEQNNLVAGDTTLTRIMEGVPPATATRLVLQGADERTTAYQLDGTMYVRTPLTLLSPGWQGSVRSADGMNVYALMSAPVLLLSDRGTVVRATLATGGSNE
jgi:intracellular multiplication protein IcmK